MALFFPRTREERARQEGHAKTLAPVVLFVATRGKGINIILFHSCCRPHHNDPPTHVGGIWIFTQSRSVGGICTRALNSTVSGDHLENHRVECYKFYCFRMKGCS